MFYFHSLDGSTVSTRKRLCVFGTFCAVWLCFDCFWRLVHRWYTIGTVLVDLWRLVHPWSFLLFWPAFDCFWLFLTIGTLLVHCWYSLGRPVTIGTPMVLSVFDDWLSIPFVKNSQRQSKDSQNSKNDHCCTNRHMSTQSPPNTQSRANSATLRDLHDTCLSSGHSPSPVGKADCMCLHGRPCVWLPFAAACCYTLFYLLMMLAARIVCQRPSSNFPYFRTPLANFLLSRPHFVEYGKFWNNYIAALG